MTIGQNGAVFRQVNRLFESGTVAGLSESELLDRFVIRGDELAFEAIVVQHGPMVLGVCRRSLSDPNDVDDAFQATFLVLVKKAATLRDRARLANWLYGVARQVSIKARASALKRRRREAGIDAADELPERRKADHPLKSVLDEELARLSDRDRAPIVLCDLEGLTGDEAADVLGLRPVTLRSRLHRSRKTLKDRLTRRGLVDGSGAPMVAASLAPTLVDRTVTVASAFAKSPAAIGIISAPVAALTQGVLKTMMLTKIKLATAMVVALGLVGTGVGVAQDLFVPARNEKDNDRLREVEQKLDRVLLALENRPADVATRPAPPVPSLPATVTKQAAPTAEAKPDRTEVFFDDATPRVEARTLAPSADAPQSKYTYFRPSPTANFPGGSIVPVDPVSGHAVYPPDRPLTKTEIDHSAKTLAEMKARARYGLVMEANPADRISRLEKRIDELDQRLRRLEGGLSGNRLPDAPAPAPAALAPSRN
jgi:RNA polymerase sigma factor (sigma-70 family)